MACVASRTESVCGASRCGVILSFFTLRRGRVPWLAVFASPRHKTRHWPRSLVVDVGAVRSFGGFVRARGGLACLVASRTSGVYRQHVLCLFDQLPIYYSC